MSYRNYGYGRNHHSYGNDGHYGTSYGNNYRGYGRSSYPNIYSYGRTRRRPNYWRRDRYARNRMRRYERRPDRREDSPPSREYSPEPAPRPLPPREEIARQLLVKDMNLHIQENAARNITDDYECTHQNRSSKEPPELVVRRGNFVKLTIRFDQPYDKEKHDLKLCFTAEEKASISNRTKVEIEVDEYNRPRYSPNEWGAYLEGRDDNDIEVMVYIAANCIVGEWNIAVNTYSDTRDGRSEQMLFNYRHDEDVIILFNPWSKADSVYLENTNLLNEYILNESGVVFTGNAWTIGARAWNFGQFEDGILDICLHLLRMGSKDGLIGEMHNPVVVSRLIAKMVNSSDDNGVLIGNWSGNYSDGKSPTSWVGSPKILQQFMNSGSVRYGQCWVFSCITTTVCRCLGIPCRTVTNFQSAHDTDETNFIEYYFHEKQNGSLEKDVVRTTDSVWNFHVWNEVWIKRPDLHEKGFDGWQTIDATPQERSNGIFTCGPCPVAALKEGRVDVPYDAGFVFSEVNADIGRFKLDGNSVEFIDLDREKIGKNISTKIPDGKPFKTIMYYRMGKHEKKKYEESKREDITLQYKYSEGTEKERRAVERAYKLARNYKRVNDPYNTEPKTEAVSIKLNHSNEVMVGSDFQLEVIIKNAGARDREMKSLSLTIASKTYKGDTKPAFYHRSSSSFVIRGRQETMLVASVPADEYLPHLVEQGSLYIEAYGSVSPTGYSNSYKKIIKSHEFRFRRPDLDVEGPENGEIGRPVTFRVSFQNPTPAHLTNCIMSMGSSGFRNKDDERLPDVSPGETYMGNFTMIPKRRKEHEVLFTFECNEIKDISGSTSIVISYGPKEAEVGTPVEFEISFKNPLPFALTGCSVSMGSAGFKDFEDEKQRDVAAGETYAGKFTMIPKGKKKEKNHEVVFTFECNELRDIGGSKSILIKKK